MPDTLNKQTLINLLIDSPLREPIKINLIDIVNNTNEPDLPKVYSTIVKELEIFQKATERRMKLAEETIAKLGGSTPATEPDFSTELPEPAAEPMATSSEPSTPPPPTLPPLDLPPLPTAPATPTPAPAVSEPTPVQPAMPPLPPIPPLPSTPTPATPVAPVMPSTPPLSVPPLDRPPLPTAPTAPTPVASEPAPAPMAPATPSSDEAALAEIQKELDSLKSAATADAAAPAVTTPAPQM